MKISNINDINVQQLQQVTMWYGAIAVVPKPPNSVKKVDDKT
jgi:hypothetical protein